MSESGTTARQLPVTLFAKDPSGGATVSIQIHRSSWESVYSHYNECDQYRPTTSYLSDAQSRSLTVRDALGSALFGSMCLDLPLDDKSFAETVLLAYLEENSTEIKRLEISQ